MKKKSICEECVQVGEGWSKLTMHMMGLLDVNSIELANKRRKICDDCPKLVKSKTAFLKCNDCGCYYPMLAYSSTKSCPMGKW